MRVVCQLAQGDEAFAWGFNLYEETYDYFDYQINGCTIKSVSLFRFLPSKLNCRKLATAKHRNLKSSHVLHTEDKLIVRILSNSRRGLGRRFIRTDSDGVAPLE